MPRASSFPAARSSSATSAARGGCPRARGQREVVDLADRRRAQAPAPGHEPLSQQQGHEDRAVAPGQVPQILAWRELLERQMLGRRAAASVGPAEQESGAASASQRAPGSERRASQAASAALSAGLRPRSRCRPLALIGRGPDVGRRRGGDPGRSRPQGHATQLREQLGVLATRLEGLQAEHQREGRPLPHPIRGSLEQASESALLRRRRVAEIAGELLARGVEQVELELRVRLQPANEQVHHAPGGLDLPEARVAQQGAACAPPPTCPAPRPAPPRRATGAARGEGEPPRAPARRPARSRSMRAPARAHGLRSPRERPRAELAGATRDGGGGATDLACRPCSSSAAVAWLVAGSSNRRRSPRRRSKRSTRSCRRSGCRSSSSRGASGMTAPSSDARRTSMRAPRSASASSKSSRSTRRGEREDELLRRAQPPAAAAAQVAHDEDAERAGRGPAGTPSSRAAGPSPISCSSSAEDLGSWRGCKSASSWAPPQPSGSPLGLQGCELNHDARRVPTRESAVVRRADGRRSARREPRAGRRSGATRPRPDARASRGRGVATPAR